MDEEDNEIGRDLREAVANFSRALKRGDIDEVDETRAASPATPIAFLVWRWLHR
jgi:hypothetical protein